ncbi:MAG: triose-phosphate isomerase [Epsilonproteobacteria bacterium]|nr:triose-phosphate isomerase [Campylobacterota bacterium]
MNKKLTYIANWKMFFTFEQTTDFVTTHYDELLDLAQTQNCDILLSPSFPSLYATAKMFETTPIKIGAQDCAHHLAGAFTGQVSAYDLKLMGCAYSIIGHSERRRYNHETDDVIAKKFELLTDQEISPILCVGENEQQYKKGETLEVIKNQTAQIFEWIKTKAPALNTIPIYIAYEPVWAIGTGNVPTSQQAEIVFEWLFETTQALAEHIDWRLLYGGSVNEQTVGSFKQTPHLDGFLIGKASTDFQELKNIVSL